MPRGLQRRDVTPFLAVLRAVLRGRYPLLPLRYSDLLASRTQPPPDIPGGPYHRTTRMYYFTRDARREVQPPLVIASASNQIAAANEDSTKPKALTPGKTYIWD